MAGKKNEVNVSLAKIDRKRMEYRWGMESFFRSHEIEAENYKEALGRYRESCLVFMSEKDIKKIEKEKNINVKRIPYINLHKIRREKPLGRWMASACFKNCGINENRYKKELEAYNQACRLRMKPEKIAVIAEKLQCRTSEFAFSEEIVDLSEIRRRLEETALKEIFIECGIDINKDAEKNGIQGCCFTANLKEVRRIEKELNCCKKEFLKSERLGEYTVDLFEVKQRIEENILQKFFEKYGMDTDEYAQAVAVYEKSGFIKAKRADIDKIEQHKKLQEKSFVKNAVDLSDIQCRLKVHKPGDIKQNLKDCGIEIQNYEEKLKTYEEASYLIMEEDDIEKLAKSLQCKREEIEIKQNQVNLLQIEEKIEKIARKKWSTLEGFFESIGVNGDYWEKIDQYENQDFIECKLSWIDKISDNIIYYSSGKCKGDWRDLLCKDEMNYIQECINKSKYYNKSSKENNLKNLAKNFGCTLEELPEKLGKEKYKVKAVELERKQKYIHVEWQEGSIYKTLSKLLKDELEDTKLLQSQSRIFNNHRIIPIKKEDCKKIVDALTCNINDISDEMVDWDLKNNPELRDNKNSVLSVANRSHIDFSGICRKIREAEEKQRTTCKIQRFILEQIANSKGYETEDLEARDIDVVKDNIKEELSKYSTQMKRKILQELLEEASNRIEYIKTETGYDCVIYFKGEKYDITDIPELPEGEDIVQHLTDAIESDLAERTNEIPGDVYEEFHNDKLPMEKIEVSEKQLSPQECQIVLEKIILLLERMDDDCKTEEKQRKAAYNEMPSFTQKMCDYYEVPNPFNIEE